MHMVSDPLFAFDYTHVTFVDLGLSIYNEEKDEKYYFIKMVHEILQRREVYLLAISEHHLQKWEYCLGLKKEAEYEDVVLRNVRLAILKKIQTQSGRMNEQ